MIAPGDWVRPYGKNEQWHVVAVNQDYAWLWGLGVVHVKDLVFERRGVLHLPSVLRGPCYPFTVYAPSRAHDSYVVAYGPHWPSRSSWIVPGTHPGFPGHVTVNYWQAANDEAAA